MDFFEYIPSKAIRDYLREVNYELSTVQAVCIACGMPYKAKREAAEYIVSHMPDCPLVFSDGDGEVELPSTHSFLQTCITLENRLLTQFLTDNVDATYCRFGRRIFHTVKPEWTAVKSLQRSVKPSRNFGGSLK